MEHISSIITSLNSNKYALILIVGVLVFAWYMVKKGYVSFAGKGLKIGTEAETRALIRDMIEYAESACDAQYSKMRPYCDSDYHTKYLIACAKDVFQKAIIYNYITSNESYVKAKQALVLNAIQKRTTNNHFFGPEFKSCCNRFVEDIVKDLYRMKLTYLKN